MQFQIKNFAGPLDLLLRLIEEDHLPVTEVSLAQVTEQYVEYLSHTPIPKEDLADFLVIASRLLLIKSRVLLPTLATDLPDDEFSLVAQLKMYQIFANAAKQMEQLWKKGSVVYPRPRPPIQAGMFAPPAGLTTDKLATVFREVLAALAPIIRLPKAAVERAVSIQEKIQQLRNLLQSQGEVSFATVMRSAQSATEVVVTFLALLELVKQRSVAVSQEALFEDITIASASV